MRKILLAFSATALVVGGCDATSDLGNNEGVDAALDGAGGGNDEGMGPDAMMGSDARTGADATGGPDAPNADDASPEGAATDATLDAPSPEAGSTVDATVDAPQGDAPTGTVVDASADGPPADSAAGEDAGADSGQDAPVDSSPQDAAPQDTAPPADASDATVEDAGGPDATAPEASIDGGPADATPADAGAGDTGPGDASLFDAGTLCGSTYCFAGQTCVTNQCVFTGCVGTNVPGDYSSIANAITALGSNGGTICLAAQAYSEIVNIPAAPFTIQGISAQHTSVEEMEIVGGNITLLGLTTELGVGPTSPGSLSVRAASLDGAPRTLPALSFIAYTGAAVPFTVTLDGVDLSTAANQNGIDAIISNNLLGLNVTVQNCYIHDTNYGVYFVGGAPITLINDTFVNNAVGMYIDVNASYFNNIITGSSLAIDQSFTSNDVFGNNLLFGNSTNYAGMAGNGPGYVKADPMFDTSTSPPGLLAGSPARGAADPTHAPATDFWGRPRGTSVDIGAVQSGP